jgi:hypothetical protein
VARKRYTVEQIITKLREVEVEMAKGATAVEVCRKLGISEQTFYRWGHLTGREATDYSTRQRCRQIRSREDRGHRRKRERHVHLHG